MIHYKNKWPENNPAYFIIYTFCISIWIYINKLVKSHKSIYLNEKHIDKIFNKIKYLHFSFFKYYMKWNKLLFTTLFSITISIFAFTDKIYAENHDKIAAIVNDDIITQSEVQSKVLLAKKQIAASNKSVSNSTELQHRILEKLIDRTIELQLAKKSGITVDAAAVDNVLVSIAKRNNATMEQMRAELRREGMSYNDYRKEIEEGMIINKIQQAAVGKDITVTDQEAQNYLTKMIHNQPVIKLPDFKQYHVMDMMIHIPDNATKSEKDTAKAKASYVLSRLRQGADFSTLVDEDKTLSSEDLGWRISTELPEIFANQVKKMEEGDIAGVIQAPNGLHIIELREIHDFKPQGINLPKQQPAPSLSEAKEAVYRQKIEEKANEWIKTMRASAYIKIINEQ